MGTLTLRIPKGSALTHGEMDANLQLFIRNDTSGTITGDLSVTGDLIAYAPSDIKFKENVREIEDSLVKVCYIGGKTFDWTNEYLESVGGEDSYFHRKSDFGVIAQDVERVFPIATRTREDGSKAVDYEKLCALAFAAIKELNAKVDDLQKQLNSK